MKEVCKARMIAFGQAGNAARSSNHRLYRPFKGVGDRHTFQKLREHLRVANTS